MSDDAPTPEAPENAATHRPAPTGDAAPPVSYGKESADTESADKVSFDKGTAPQAPSVQETASETAGASPWAPPADAAPGDGPGHTIASGISPAPAPPSVHHQQTGVSMPGADNGADNRADNGQIYGANNGGAPAQPWASPFAAPNPGGQGGQGGPGGGFPPPHHTVPAGSPADPGNPFAPPAHGGAEHVPPPPIAPDGPGQMPYGYPGGYAYPARPGYGGAHGPQAPGVPGYYGWPGMPPMANNGMGTAGLVLGILSAIVFCLWPIAIIMGILGVIFGAIGRKRANRGEATNGGQALAGLICGAVGIALGIGMIVLLIVAP